MFVAMSRFRVANGLEDAVDKAFQQRPHLVDQVTGFLRMDVLRPMETPTEFWLMTYWTDEDSYQRWHRSDEHHASHLGMPKGLKLERGHTEVRYFTHVCT